MKEQKNRTLLIFPLEFLCDLIFETFQQHILIYAYICFVLIRGLGLGSIDKLLPLR